METLDGKVVVVTGAASGIGFALANEFSRQGSRVMLLDIEENLLVEKTREIQSRGGIAECLRVDVTSLSDLKAAAQHTDQVFGGTDVLINNAGVGVKGATWDLELDDWRWVLDVCMWGVINGITAFLPTMIERKTFGHVINTGSMMSFGSASRGAPYQAAKQAVAAISETLFFDLQESAPQIGVTLLCPGYTSTNIRTSQRNRSANYGKPQTRTNPVSSSVANTKYSDPTEIAELAVRAVLSNQFYAFANWELWEPIISERFESILRRESPISVKLTDVKDVIAVNS